MNQKFLTALALSLIVLPAAVLPVHSQAVQSAVLVAQSGDSVEVDAENARQEAKLAMELADLRAQVGYMEKLVADFKTKLEVMTGTMEKMKKSNRKQ